MLITISIWSIFFLIIEINFFDAGGEIMAVWKCTKCGETKEGRCRPAVCPKCGAPKESFEKQE